MEHTGEVGGDVIVDELLVEVELELLAGVTL